MKQLRPDTVRLAPVAHDLIQLSWRVLRITTRAVLDRPEAPSLRPTQLRALGVMLGSPGVSLSELADQLGLQKPAASKVVDELVRRRLVRREIVPHNRRMHALHVTARGERALDAATSPAGERVAELLARLDARERDTVARAMALLLPLVRTSPSPSKPSSKD
jgi:DNA-binding MarR family transcriptional regulator